MALLREAGHSETMYAGEFPAVEPGGQLRFGQPTFHGEQPATAGHQVCASPHQIRNRSYGARNDRPEPQWWPVRLGPALNDLDVCETELAGHVAQKVTLFPGGLDQREMPCRLDDGERYAGEASAAAQVGDPLAPDPRTGREAVQNVLGELLLPVTDRSQVHARPPLVHQVEMADEPRHLLGRELEAQRASAVGERSGQLEVPSSSPSRR